MYKIVNVLFIGVRLVDLRGVCARLLDGVRLEGRTVFFLSLVLLVFLDGVLTCVLPTANFLGVDRRGDECGFEAVL